MDIDPGRSGRRTACRYVVPCAEPLQAALWGLGRVVMNEYPALSCTLIDLACNPNAADTPARLENELLRP